MFYNKGFPGNYGSSGYQNNSTYNATTQAPLVNITVPTTNFTNNVSVYCTYLGALIYSNFLRKVCKMELSISRYISLYLFLLPLLILCTDTYNFVTHFDQLVFTSSLTDPNSPDYRAMENIYGDSVSYHNYHNLL